MKDKANVTAKSILHFVLFLLAAHLLFGVLLFNIGFNRIVAEMAEDGMVARGNTVVLLFGLASLLIFCIYYTISGARDAEYTSVLKAAMKEEGFSVLRYFAKTQCKMNLYRVVAFAVFQIPFAIFFAFFGFSLDLTTGVEAFYRLEAGMYGLTGSWLLGFVLMTLVFGTVLFVCQFVCLFLCYRRVLANAPAGMYR